MAKKRKKVEGACGPTVDKEWQARNDLDTISRAHEIIKDTARFKSAKAEAKRQSESLARIQRLEGKKL